MSSLKENINRVAKKGNALVYEPRIFDLQVPGESDAFQSLLESHQEILVTEEIKGQLQELVKLRVPQQTSFTENEVEEMVQAHLKGVEMYEYGLWIHYPWSNRLVHILPKDEFIEVRTNRNKNKITQQESHILNDKKVGVIGLSVGQSVSVTMAMERSFGEIRLADFDKLELTNLNRIRTGLHNLGLPKVISVAREIKEIDPFLKVEVFGEGITEENIDDFFMRNGKLDAVIDECDGLDIKVLCRVKAKELKVPVLMEASDRGTIDIERFDLEPDRPLLHGFIDHLDISKIKDLKTNEEKIPYLLPIAGIDTLSKKMKASMLEIGQSLTTWPQLSSAVTLGGGITADTYRRMMLSEIHVSGRFFVDLEDFISDETLSKQDLNKAPLDTLEPLLEEEIEALLNNIQLNGVDRAKIEPTFAKELITAAATAPSAGNNQPWKWVVKDHALFLFHDRSRSVSFSDYADMGSMLAFGASIENVAILAYSRGFDIHVNYFPMHDENRLICRLTLFEGGQNETQEFLLNQALHLQISDRHTNRQKGQGEVDSRDLLKLKEIAEIGAGCEFVSTEDPHEINTLAEVVSACERLRIMHPEGHKDFFDHEVRWTDEESKSSGDGIDISTVELNASELAGMKLASDPEVVDYLRKWDGGKGFEKLSKETVQQSPSVGLLRVKQFDRVEFIKGGRNLQRVWLMATKLNLSIHPISAGLFMFARLFHGQGMDLNDRQKTEIAELHDKFELIFPSEEDSTNLFMFRIFKSDKPAIRSYRLPIDQVFSQK